MNAIERIRQEVISTHFDDNVVISHKDAVAIFNLLDVVSEIIEEETVGKVEHVVKLTKAYCGLVYSG